MKRVLRHAVFSASQPAAAALSDLKQYIKEFNADSRNHVTVKGDSYRFNSYEGDYYCYGKLSDAADALQELHDSGDVDVDIGGLLIDCASDEIGAHHAFEVSEVSQRKRDLDAKYRFGSNAAERDQSWRAVAQRIMDQIYELAELNNIPIVRTIDLADPYYLSVKPRVRRGVISGTWFGVCAFIASKLSEIRDPNVRKLTSLVRANLNKIGQVAGATSIELKNNIIFTY